MTNQPSLFLELNGPVALRFTADGRLHRDISRALELNGERYCARCKKVKKLTEFSGNSSWCKRCYKTYSRERNRKRLQQKKEVRYLVMQKCVTLLGAKCQRCGFNEFQASLDFHHVYPNKKSFGISWYLSSRKCELTKELLDELDKCALLCKNCHHGFETGGWNTEWKRRDGCGWTCGGV